MGKYYIRLVDSYTGEKVHLEGTTKEILNRKIERQNQKWQEAHFKLEKETLLNQMEENANIYRNAIKKLDLIIESVNIPFDIGKLYLIKNEQEGLVPYKSKYVQPTLQESYRALFNRTKLQNNRLLMKLSPKYKQEYILKENAAQVHYAKQVEEYKLNQKNEIDEYEKSRTSLIEINKKHNKEVNQKKARFYNRNKIEVEKILRELMKELSYIDLIELDFELEYIPERKMVVVERKLPSRVNIPEYADVRVNTKTLEISYINWKEKDLVRVHENVILQIVLLNISDLFRVMPNEIIDRIVFNGWIDHINPATGQENHSCVISLDVEREEFEKINIRQVDYKTCIKGLKGVITPNLTMYLPVQPKLVVQKQDKRFVNSLDISDQLTDGFNLAIMEWDDFEHLIRMLFEKIFTSKNIKVNVTQASRDGGVDAIAFDPDPIKGGSYVIQAKRYNILVPVSAVRDLYGTMLHEGANKGILVTTSSYGKDSYSFAKDKPITLINGNELLGLLHDNGFKNVTIKLSK